MTEPVRVPNPVYDRLTHEAESQDVSRGVIVKQWMEKAEKFDNSEGY